MNILGWKSGYNLIEYPIRKWYVLRVATNKLWGKTSFQDALSSLLTHLSADIDPKGTNTFSLQGYLQMTWAMPELPANDLGHARFQGFVILSRKVAP
jgi:hypothetical protein